jgi:hypothetical protein
VDLPKHWTKLQSARRGRCRGHLGKPTQHYTLLKNIYTFVSIFIISVSVVASEQRKLFLVRAQCFSCQHLFYSFPRLQLASYLVTTASVV